MPAVTKALHTRETMAAAGRLAVRQMCHANGWRCPQIFDYLPPKSGGTCGLYINGRIYVEPRRCARLGYGGPAWSWPGYMVDRTPYGVYPHELGHYVDHLFSGPKFTFSRTVYEASGEPPITGYAPNRAEWFAEMFRLFVTNPDLLMRVRPRTYGLLVETHGINRIEFRPWATVMAGAPVRTFAMARKRIKEVING